MGEIFLSYAHQDRPLALLLVEAFERMGWKDVWWDHRLLGGDRYREVIERKIKAARCMVVVWSSHSVKSDFVKDEAEVGKECNILVPLLAEKGTDLPIGFRQLHTIDLTGWKGAVTHPGFVQLAKALSPKLRTKPATRRVARPGTAGVESFLQPAGRSGEAGAWATPPADRLATDLSE